MPIINIQDQLFSDNLIYFMTNQNIEFRRVIKYSIFSNTEIVCPFVCECFSISIGPITQEQKYVDYSF